MWNKAVKNLTIALLPDKAILSPLLLTDNCESARNYEMDEIVSRYSFRQMFVNCKHFEKWCYWKNGVDRRGQATWNNVGPPLC